MVAKNAILIGCKVFPQGGGGGGWWRGSALVCWEKTFRALRRAREKRSEESESEMATY